MKANNLNLASDSKLRAMVFPPLHSVYAFLYLLVYNIWFGQTVSNDKAFSFVLLSTFLYNTVVMYHARLS